MDTRTTKDASRVTDNKTRTEKSDASIGQAMKDQDISQSKGASKDTKQAQTPEKAKPQERTHVDLKRANFRDSTREAMPTKEGEARRHIISSHEMQTAIEKELNGKTLDSAASALRQKDASLIQAHPKSNQEVQQAAEHLYRDAFNDQKNLWVGSQAENVRVGTAVDKPKEWNNYQLGAHKRDMKRKYFWGDTKF
ncbi:MAG: hypothetical protein AAF614_06940 [Chloroflexota bacterium]